MIDREALEAVCFDLDGTLIDSTEAIVSSFLHAFNLLGVPAPAREEIVGTISVPLEEQFKLLSDVDPDEAASVYRKHYLATALSGTHLLPGAEQGLRRLKAAGLKLAIATSKRRSSAEPLLESLGILSLFEVCIGPEDVEHPKPHPESLHRVMEHLEVTPRAMAFIGDTAFDANAAARAGVPCICVTTGYESRESLESLETEAVLDSLNAVVDKLLGV